jgi:negative regulator of sigma E activity
MRDHVTEERISAYADGELAGDELKLVESLLAESVEYRQLLAELQGLRASLRALPRFNLPADFQTRIVDQIDGIAASPADKPVPPARQDSKTRPWQRVLVAVASLAALIAFTVMLRPPTPTPLIDGSTVIGTTPAMMPVYLQQEPKYVAVYDVTVTPAGQASGVVEELLKKYGIGIDPALRLGEKLENELMVIRESPLLPGGIDAVPYKTDLATPKSANQDKVEMIYVAGKLHTLDKFGLDLEQLSDAGEELSQLHYDMVIEPDKLGVMHRLHDSVREHFTHNMKAVPSETGQAFRLSFHVELTSFSVPGAAILPVPTIRAKSALSKRNRNAKSLDVNRDGKATERDAIDVISQLNRPDAEGPGALVATRQPTPEEMQPGHVLLILRNVGAKAGDGK